MFRSFTAYHKSENNIIIRIDNIMIYKVPLNHDALQCAPCQVY